jgi:predicted CoA-substrate-specific enzyme activase
MLFLGLDIGSCTCNAVLIDENRNIIDSMTILTGPKNRDSISSVRSGIMRSAAVEEGEICAMVSTGYGRDKVEGRIAAVTEITCHARGIQEVIPGTGLLIDIGGQDSKTIVFDGAGKVSNFIMNDKCAAGTGRFLEAMARVLHVDVDELGNLDRDARGILSISSTCTVFAESEVVSHIAEGAEVKEIVRGINNSIASRITAMVKRIASELSGIRISMSGGVAKNNGVIRSIEAALGSNMNVPEKPDIIGALGAALIARERFNKPVIPPSR